jgi:putative chitinase
VISLQQFAGIIGCTSMTAGVWYVPMAQAMLEFGIDDGERMARFLANVGHETGSLNRVEESLNYSAQRALETWPRRFPGGVADAAHYEYSPEKLANHVYSNRFGNGGETSGDGWHYRGRGPFQITFADNYRACGAALNLPLIEVPEMLLEPKHGCRSAGWFWQSRDCNDAPTFDAVCDRINLGRDTTPFGDSNGFADRLARYERALSVLDNWEGTP